MKHSLCYIRPLPGQREKSDCAVVELSCNAASPFMGTTMFLNLYQNLVSYSCSENGEISGTEMSLSALCLAFLHIITEREFLLKES